MTLSNVSRSWITYYFKYQFDIEEGELGSIFFVTQMLAAVSMIAASSLAKRFGNVNVPLSLSLFSYLSLPMHARHFLLN